MKNVSKSSVSIFFVRLGFHGYKTPQLRCVCILDCKLTISCTHLFLDQGFSEKVQTMTPCICQVPFELFSSQIEWNHTGFSTSKSNSPETKAHYRVPSTNLLYSSDSIYGFIFN